MPRRRALGAVLGEAGVGIEDVGLVINCHFHFDHCGGNPQLRGRPIAVQAVELDTARRTDAYTLPHLVDAPGLRYEVLDGEAGPMSGVFVIPTPGHTSGHQSVVVRLGKRLSSGGRAEPRHGQRLYRRCPGLAGRARSAHGSLALDSGLGRSASGVRSPAGGLRPRPLRLAALTGPLGDTPRIGTP